MNLLTYESRHKLLRKRWYKPLWLRIIVRKAEVKFKTWRVNSTPISWADREYFLHDIQRLEAELEILEGRD